MADAIEYTVKGDMRWDSISNAVYGSSDYINTITDANPDVPVTPVVASGTLLQIPILPVAEVQISSEQLPLWKQ